MRLMSIILFAISFLSQPAFSQGLFSPVIAVNDQVITKYELSQRQLMLSALGVRGDLAEEARSGLIADRLKVKAAEDAGIVATDEQIANAMSEFSARGNRSTEELVAMLAQNGVASETLRDFTHANFVWQTMIRQKYGSSVSISEAEIDAALAATSEATNLQVLVSEIVLPLIEGQEEQIRKLAHDITNLGSYDEFSSAARQFSVAGSRENGGELEWISIGNLPPALRPVLLSLTNGQISEPLELPNAIALFQMRGVREMAPNSASYTSIEYTTLTIAEDDTGSAAERLNAMAARALRCSDLEGLASDLPEEALVNTTLPPSDIPTRTALWLARLDAGEKLVETIETEAEGTAAVLVMLCNRTSVANRDVSRGEVRNRLISERLTARSNSLLESLRASARITSQ